MRAICVPHPLALLAVAIFIAAVIMLALALAGAFDPAAPAAMHFHGHHLGHVAAMHYHGR